MGMLLGCSPALTPACLVLECELWGVGAHFPLPVLSQDLCGLVGSWHPPSPALGWDQMDFQPGKHRCIPFHPKPSSRPHFPCKSQKLVQKTHVQFALVWVLKALQPAEGSEGFSASNSSPEQLILQHLFQALC